MLSEMSDERFSQLAPRDVSITLRSLRRRFGAIAGAINRPELSRLVDAPGPDHHSLTSLLTTAAQAMSVISNETERALDHDEPVIAGAALRAAERTFTDDRTWSVAQSIDSLADDAERIAERLERATAAEQARSVAVVGGGETNPLDLARELGRTAIEALEEAEKQLAWMRAQA